MKVIFHSHFIKKYSKLSKNIRAKTDEKLFLFETDTRNPILNTHQLNGVWKDHWSINITGNIRAVFIFIANDTVQFVEVDNHNNLYK
jgi:addiction module RelE/StbE family toxin